MPGLYLHIPFCRSKCPYCDFYSVTAREAALAEYPERLLQHLNLSAWRGGQSPIETVYFGGGTPSLLAPAAIAHLLDAVSQRLSLAPDPEITLEVNPGTVNLNQLAGFRAAGINRLSIGVQTLQEQQLEQIGRRHTRLDGLAAVALARRAGFEQISLDLMFALPGQTLAQLKKDLDEYLALDAVHLSCYGLTAETGTALTRAIEVGQQQLPADDFYADAYLTIHERLTQAGYDHYEIANYARPGQVCRHNLIYWQRQPYLGLGAGAHSFRPEGWGSRWAVPADLSKFQESLDRGKDPAEHLESFDRRGALSETLYLGLRTASGITDAELQERFTTDLTTAYPEAVEQLSEWLVRRDDRWAFTPGGWLFFDRLIQAFL